MLTINRICINYRRVIAITMTLFLLAAIMAVLSLPSTGSSAEAATIDVSVSSNTVRSGETFTVSILVTPNNSIAGAQFNLAFDSSLVTVDSVEEGNLLSQDGASTYFNSINTDNQAGSITGIAGVIITPGETVSTAGTLATITMAAKTSDGTSSLTLSNVIIGSAQGQSIQSTINNGEVTVNANQPLVLNSFGDNSVNEAATAPDFSVAEDTALTNQVFIDQGASCSGACPMNMDYSNVDISTPGDYAYGVICGGDCGNDTDQGIVTVISAIESHTVTFTAGTGGSLSGETAQIIPDGEDCTTVTAHPDPGYQFVNWVIIMTPGSGYFSNLYGDALTISHVMGDIQATANVKVSAATGGGSVGGGGGGFFLPPAVPSVPTPTSTPTPVVSPTPIPTPPPPPPPPPPPAPPTPTPTST
ncbi:MAG: hypothetical protein HQ553_18075, partial [Chloroflexi bacterium]|nr:hypothetical protein [Chloroflexota bacterium]